MGQLGVIDLLDSICFPVDPGIGMDDLDQMTVVETWVGHSDARVRRNRAQARGLYPLIVHHVASRPHIPLHMAVWAAIDRGDPLIDSLSRTMGVEKRVVRVIQEKDCDLLGDGWWDHPSDLLQAIRLIPNEKLPQSADEWRLKFELWILCTQTDSLTFLQSLNWSSQSSAGEYVFSGLCRMGFHQAVHKVSVTPAGDMQRLVGLTDYFDLVSLWCEFGAGVVSSGTLPSESTGNNRVGDEFLMRYSPMELVRQNEVWHQLSHYQTADPAGEGDIDDWPALPGLPLTAGYLSVVPLINRQELNLEGARLKHCVATHAHRCLTGQSHVVSIRTPANDSVSTAEIILVKERGGRLKPVVTEHRGMGNAKPEPVCRDALATALIRIADEHHATRLLELNAFHAERNLKLGPDSLFEMSGLTIPAVSEMMDKILPDPDRARQWLRARYAQ